MDKYIIDLMNDEDDNFDQDGDNVARVSVIGEYGIEIKNCRVMIEISKNGLLGLGTECIRMANSFTNGFHTHIHPATKNLISENMGLFLTPDSIELIFNTVEMSAIDTVDSKYKPENDSKR